MKRLIACFIFLSLLLSCNGKLKLSDELLFADRELVRILSHTLNGNDEISVSLSDTAMLVEYTFKGIRMHSGAIGSSFSIPLPAPLEMGEVECFSLTLKKDTGAITRASFLLVGKNKNIPSLIINELSIKGTSTAPDRIELLALTSGNLKGVIVSDELDFKDKEHYSFPDMEVQAGDIIVLYWDREGEERRIVRKNGSSTYFMNARMDSTLISTDGLLAIFADYDGHILDALIYSDDPENEENPFGTEVLKEKAEYLIKEGFWYGEPIDSSLVTSSRVLARFPDIMDSDSAEDWFTTEAKKSSFGEENTAYIYSP